MSSLSDQINKSVLLIFRSALSDSAAQVKRTDVAGSRRFPAGLFPSLSIAELQEGTGGSSRNEIHPKERSQSVKAHSHCILITVQTSIRAFFLYSESLLLLYVPPAHSLLLQFSSTSFHCEFHHPKATTPSSSLYPFLPTLTFHKWHCPANRAARKSHSDRPEFATPELRTTPPLISSDSRRYHRDI
ncbi:hypothetical protein AVEN_187585-1 [Araneus ventricosus]|uniref:Uncharacterized protein n=1 Tax=Araneus ventricosus TaxID=182803 RepID=A0A4Y2FRY1_ARAVE|nr:hypothetical protein AVEN_187585-1 [Araneus ventricosus]